MKCNKQYFLFIFSIYASNFKFFLPKKRFRKAIKMIPFKMILLSTNNTLILSTVIEMCFILSKHISK